MSADHEKFVQQVQQTGGASMNLSTGKLLPPDARGYMVGGESDRSGQQIPAWSVPEHEFSTDHVGKFVDYMKSVVGSSGRGLHVGAWKDEGNVEMDASRKIKRPGEAIRKGRARGEKAIYDIKGKRDIDTGGRQKRS
jgi:hypothetical protein